MEFKYTAVLIVGIVLALIFSLMCFLYKKAGMKGESVKLANSDLLLTDKYYKKQMVTYYILRAVLVISVCLMIVLTAVLLARPYYVKKIKEQKYNRDIILCMDISSSVDDLNLKLVKDLQDTVRSLSGERIGIVIFNTTPVVLSPMTDDYEYTIEQLENIRTAIKSQNSNFSLNTTDWLYWNEYLYGGTLVGNQLRGSSLIGDGLLGGLFAFTEDSKDRTKIIIFSTDNDPNGEGYVNLQEAADYCTRNDVTVYGIGTKLMRGSDKDEMEKAVRSTGGKFFIEEKASSFHEIVEEIDSKSVALTEGKTIIKLIESPEKYFAALVVVFIVFFIVSILLRRANVLWSISSGAMALLLVLVFVFAVIPAKQFSKGPDLNVKKKSNLNVVLVIDNTLSMLGNDMKNGSIRMEKVMSDACAIVDELEGAKFTVIGFNNEASLVAPTSSDTSHVKRAIKSLTPIESFYANGSSLSTPKELMTSILKAAKASGDQQTAVFYFSDGEITAEGVGLESFAELKQYVDYGGVYGYGTKEGGTMTYKNPYTEELEQIEDHDTWPFEVAVTRIDEDNLKTIASDMGITYENMNSDVPDVSGLRSHIKFTDEIEKQESGEEYINPPVYYGFFALIPFAILVLLNAGYVIKRR